MDCTDIIIIGARGRTHRIRDYYTRDRSMPREDEMYGGAYSLTSAVAAERAGKTTAIFRRKLNSNDSFPDYNITDTAMHVIWAIGQTPGDINHSPQSSLEANEASNRDFYQPDEIKYHGSVNRGATQINFFSKDSPYDCNEYHHLAYFILSIDPIHNTLALACLNLLAPLSSLSSPPLPALLPSC